VSSTPPPSASSALSSLASLLRQASIGSPGWWAALSAAVGAGVGTFDSGIATYLKAVVYGVGGLVVLIYTHEVHSTKRATTTAQASVSVARETTKAAANQAASSANQVTAAQIAGSHIAALAAATLPNATTPQ
jgi:hypothetical protein